MSTQTIRITVAMPTDGNDIEHLNAGNYARNIAQGMQSAHPEHRFLVTVIDNDGTAKDDLSELPEGVDATDAIANAFADESSYDAE